MARAWSARRSAASGAGRSTPPSRRSRSGWAAAKPGAVDGGPAVAEESAQRHALRRRDSSDAVTRGGGGESSGLGGRVPRRTRRPTRSGQRSASSWAIIPPIERPTTVGAAEPELVDDAEGVVGQVADRVRPRGVARPAAAAVVDADDPVVRLEGADSAAGHTRPDAVQPLRSTTPVRPRRRGGGPARPAGTASGRGDRARCLGADPASSVAATPGCGPAPARRSPDAAAQPASPPPSPNAQARPLGAGRRRRRRRRQDRSRRRSLPVVVRGSASTNVTVRGTL